MDSKDDKRVKARTRPAQGPNVKQHPNTERVVISRRTPTATTIGRTG